MKSVWHIAIYNHSTNPPTRRKGKQISRKEAKQLGADVNRMYAQAKRLGETVYAKAGLGGIYCTVV